MTKSLSVIIPTFNPHPGRLAETLNSLRKQTLPIENWELILIDNKSTKPIEVDLSWHPSAIMLREERQGLTFARLKGFEAANGDTIVMVDDDNILDKDYLKNMAALFDINTNLGTAGGKLVPRFESRPPSWLKPFYGNLALRDLGESTIISQWDNSYPSHAPVGAGMGIRREALTEYCADAKASRSQIVDRTAGQLGSGGDNDIVITTLKAGWQTGYFPELSLTHIIPQARTEFSYVCRLVNHTGRSWIAVLEKHQINPWAKISRWTVPIRKAKAWVKLRAWASKENYIRWQGACGQFDGLATI